MAIQPIDLQTMYTSVEKISKAVAFEQQGKLLHKSMTEEVKTKKNAEQKQLVQKTEDQENAQTVKERKDHNNSQDLSADTNTSKKEKQKSDSSKEETQKEYEQIKDPCLGRRVDVSG